MPRKDGHDPIVLNNVDDLSSDEFDDEYDPKDGWDSFESNRADEEELTVSQLQFLTQFLGDDPDDKQAQLKLYLLYIVHALGIEVLYGKDVEMQYRPKKAVHLSASELPEPAKLKKLVDDTVATVISRLLTRVSKVGIVAAKFLKSKKYRAWRDALVANEVEALLFCKADEEDDFDLSGPLAKLVELFCHAYKDKLTFFKPKEVEGYNFSHKSVPGDFYDAAVNQAVECLRKFSRVTKGGLKKPPVKVLKEKLEANPKATRTKDCFDRFEYLGKLVLEHFEKTSSRGGAYTKTIVEQIDETELTEAYLKDLIARNEYLKGQKPLCPEALAGSVDGPSFLFKYMKFSDKRVRWLLEDRFEAFFMQELVELRQERQVIVDRQLLPEAMTLSSQSVHDFLANIRLANCSANRYLRQGDDEQQLTKRTVQRAWCLVEGAKAALETQEITVNGCRSDKVLNQGSYGAVMNDLLALKSEVDDVKYKGKLREESQQLTDPLVAEWMRKVLCGEPIAGDIAKLKLPIGLVKKLQQFIVDLTYLLFGTEVVRNPASLIMQQMALDLVEYGDVTWKKMLADPDKVTCYGGGLIPMTIGKHKVGKAEYKGSPVESARFLHGLFGYYTRHQYEYPGNVATDTAKALELAKREVDLTEMWFQKFAPKALSSANKEQILECLQKDIADDWYRSPAVPVARGA